MATTKGKKFSEDDDLVLLTLVLSKLLFAQSKGQVMRTWDEIADVARETPGFSKPDINGKNAQAHYNFLISSHQENAPTLETASGDSQEYPERLQLLDELLVQETENASALDRGEPLRDGDGSGCVQEMKHIREAAAAALAAKRTATTEKTSPAGKKQKLSDLDKLLADNEKDREARARVQHEECEERRRERDEERAERRREQEAARSFHREMASLFADQLMALGAAAQATFKK